VARLLRAAGHDAVHVRDYGFEAAVDPVILERARVEDRGLISADSDFATLLAVMRLNKPRFMLFREADIIRAQDYVSRIVGVPLSSAASWMRAASWFSDVAGFPCAAFHSRVRLHSFGCFCRCRGEESHDQGLVAMIVGDPVHELSDCFRTHVPLI